MTTRKPRTAETTWTVPADPVATQRQPKAPAYVKGSHTARVRTEQDERRVELLALRDVLDAQRVAIVDQIEDIGSALSLLSDPGANIVPLRQAGE